MFVVVGGAIVRDWAGHQSPQNMKERHATGVWVWKAEFETTAENWTNFCALTALLLQFYYYHISILRHPECSMCINKRSIPFWNFSSICKIYFHTYINITLPRIWHLVILFQLHRFYIAHIRMYTHIRIIKISAVVGRKHAQIERFVCIGFESIYYTILAYFSRLNVRLSTVARTETSYSIFNHIYL